MKECSLKNFCTKFQRSIIAIIEFTMYGAALAAFFMLFSIDNPEIISLSRTAAVTLSTYVIMLFLLSNTYFLFVKCNFYVMTFYLYFIKV